MHHFTEMESGARILIFFNIKNAFRSLRIQCLMAAWEYHEWVDHGYVFFNQCPVNGHLGVFCCCKQLCSFDMYPEHLTKCLVCKFPGLGVKEGGKRPPSGQMARFPLFSHQPLD